MAEAPKVVTVTRPTKGTEIEPGEPQEVEAVTGRPPDEAPENSTLATRAAARRKASKKQVAEAENKAVKASETEKKSR
jgi:hypothetical protein